MTTGQKSAYSPAATARFLTFTACFDLALAGVAAFVLPEVMGTDHVELGLGFTLYHVLGLGFLIGSAYLLVLASRFKKIAASKAGPIQR